MSATQIADCIRTLSDQVSDPYMLVNLIGRCRGESVDMILMSVGLG